MGSEAHAKPTIKDVAERAGVSSATVSYVMSGRSGGRSRISEATRKRVLDAARDLDYAPNLAARSLRTQETHRIALVIPTLAAPYFELLADTLAQTLARDGFSLIVLLIGTLETELQTIRTLRQGLADGAVIYDPRFVSGNALAQLARKGVAMLVFSNRLEPQGFDVVRIDASEAREAAVTHLVDRGHNRIALLSNSQNSSNVDRMKDYLRILHDFNLSVDPRLVRTDVHDLRSAYEATTALLNKPDPPTAILALADRMAMGALLAGQHAGMKIPDDLAIIGEGNIPESEITFPPLTTIGPPELDFSQVAELIMTRLNGMAPDEGRQHKMSQGLIVRESS